MFQDNRWFHEFYFFGYRDTYKDVPPMPLEKLQILKSIKEISDYLLVQFVNHTSVTSLDFLSNLEKIQGLDPEQYVCCYTLKIFALV